MPIISIKALERPIPKPLRTIHSMLKEAFDNVEFRWSRRGVPHILVTTTGETFSVCYFGKDRIYRVFSPYYSQGNPQIKRDFEELRDIIRYIRGEIYECKD